MYVNAEHPEGIETQLEPSQISKITFWAKIVKGTIMQI